MLTVGRLPVQSPWGIWTRAWTAEENRHGDLMNKYAYLSGRVDMRVRGLAPPPVRPQCHSCQPAHVVPLGGCSSCFLDTVLPDTGITQAHGSGVLA